MSNPTPTDIAWLSEVVKRTGSFNIVKRKNYAGYGDQKFIYEARFSVNSQSRRNLERLKKVVGSGYIAPHDNHGYKSFQYHANSLGTRRVLELIDKNTLCTHKRERAVVAEKFIKTVGKPVNEAERALLHSMMKSKMAKFPS